MTRNVTKGPSYLAGYISITQWTHDPPNKEKAIWLTKPLTLSWRNQPLYLFMMTQSLSNIVWKRLRQSFTLLVIETYQVKEISHSILCATFPLYRGEGRRERERTKRREIACLWFLDLIPLQSSTCLFCLLSEEEQRSTETDTNELELNPKPEVETGVALFITLDRPKESHCVRYCRLQIKNHKFLCGLYPLVTKETFFNRSGDGTLFGLLPLIGTPPPAYPDGTRVFRIEIFLLYLSSPFLSYLLWYTQYFLCLCIVLSCSMGPDEDLKRV